MTSKIKAPLESWEQEKIFNWRNENMSKYPALALLHSSGNGLRLTPGQAVKAKKQGLTKGVPDIMLPVEEVSDNTLIYPHHGLFIELKRKIGGNVSPEQKAFLWALKQQGFKCKVCYGSDHAIETIKKYLGIIE